MDPTRGARLQPRDGQFATASTLASVLLAVIVVAALYLCREVLVPIALAILLSFVLSPLVRLLHHFYLPRGVAVAIVAFVAFSAIFALGALMVSQVGELAAELPSYQTTLRNKIQALRGDSAGVGALKRASEVLQDLGKEIDQPKSEQIDPRTGRRVVTNKPIQVQLAQPDLGVLQTVANLIGPLLQPLTTTGIVAIFVIFILVQQSDLRNRLVRLAGAQDLQRTTAAINETGERLSRLFLTQIVLNAAFGAVIGLGLSLIGVPSAPLWGMLAMIMRFVPYVGVLIAAIFPLVIAAAVGEGWTMALWTAALFIGAEPIVGYFIEPLVYGHSAGLSPIAVIAAATFWTWLWGPIGLILATPLTICLVVLGRHVDRLKFLDVMFGDTPPLTPAELVYQRMLARDPVEASEQAESFLKDRTLIAYYDEILLEALRLARADAMRGTLDPERMQRVHDAAVELIDDLSPHAEKREAQPDDDSKNPEPSPLARLHEAESRLQQQTLNGRWAAGQPVLCIGGRDMLDEVAATMVAQLVTGQGIGARVETRDALSLSGASVWDPANAEAVCLCYVESATPAQVHYAVRRVRRRAPHIFILAALLGESSQIEIAAGEDADVATRSLRSVVEKIVARASSSSEVQDPLQTDAVHAA
jgi:predicted PurR-regulated permease PerM